MHKTRRLLRNVLILLAVGYAALCLYVTVWPPLTQCGLQMHTKGSDSTVALCNEGWAPVVLRGVHDPADGSLTMYQGLVSTPLPRSAVGANPEGDFHIHPFAVGERLAPSEPGQPYSLNITWNHPARAGLTLTYRYLGVPVSLKLR